MEVCRRLECATLLSVSIGKYHTLFCNTVNVRCLIPHHAHVVGADVPVPDVVAPDDQDVGLLLLSYYRRGGQCQSDKSGDQGDSAGSKFGVLYVSFSSFLLFFIKRGIM